MPRIERLEDGRFAVSREDMARQQMGNPQEAMTRQPPMTPPLGGASRYAGDRLDILKPGPAYPVQQGAM